MDKGSWHRTPLTLEGRFRPSCVPADADCARSRALVEARRHFLGRQHLEAAAARSASVGGVALAPATPCAERFLAALASSLDPPRLERLAALPAVERHELHAARSEPGFRLEGGEEVSLFHIQNGFGIHVVQLVASRVDDALSKTAANWTLHRLRRERGKAGLSRSSLGLGIGIGAHHNRRCSWGLNPPVSRSDLAT